MNRGVEEYRRGALDRLDKEGRKLEQPPNGRFPSVSLWSRKKLCLAGHRVGGPGGLHFHVRPHLRIGAFPGVHALSVRDVELTHPPNPGRLRHRVDDLGGAGRGVVEPALRVHGAVDQAQSIKLPGNVDLRPHDPKIGNHVAVPFGLVDHIERRHDVLRYPPLRDAALYGLPVVVFLRRDVFRSIFSLEPLDIVRVQRERVALDPHAVELANVVRSVRCRPARPQIDGGLLASPSDRGLHPAGRAIAQVAIEDFQAGSILLDQLLARQNADLACPHRVFPARHARIRIAEVHGRVFAFDDFQALFETAIPVVFGGQLEDAVIPGRGITQRRHVGAVRVAPIFVLPDQTLEDVRSVFVRPAAHWMSLGTGRIVARFVFDLVDRRLAPVDRDVRSIVANPRRDLAVSPLVLAAHPHFEALFRGLSQMSGGGLVAVPAAPYKRRDVFVAEFRHSIGRDIRVSRELHRASAWRRRLRTSRTDTGCSTLP